MGRCGDRLLMLLAIGTRKFRWGNGAGSAPSPALRCSTAILSPSRMKASSAKATASSGDQGRPCTSRMRIARKSRPQAGLAGGCPARAVLNRSRAAVAREQDSSRDGVQSGCSRSPAASRRRIASHSFCARVTQSGGSGCPSSAAMPSPRKPGIASRRASNDSPAPAGADGSSREMSPNATSPEYQVGCRKRGLVALASRWWRMTARSSRMSSRSPGLCPSPQRSSARPIAVSASLSSSPAPACAVAGDDRRRAAR